MEIYVHVNCSLCGSTVVLRVPLTEEGHVDMQRLRELARRTLGWRVERWQDDGTTKFQCPSCVEKTL